MVARGRGSVRLPIGGQKPETARGRHVYFYFIGKRAGLQVQFWVLSQFRGARFQSCRHRMAPLESCPTKPAEVAQRNTSSGEGAKCYMMYDDKCWQRVSQRNPVPVYRSREPR